MKIYIASDHAGVKEKTEITQLLTSLGFQIEDLGPTNEDRVNYPDYAIKLCKEILEQNSRGILICGTGIGMSITANKFQGIRATLCRDEFEAQMSREHNDSNVLCLGARTTELEMLKKISKIWAETEFAGGRHGERLAIFKDLGSKINE